MGRDHFGSWVSTSNAQMKSQACAAMSSSLPSPSMSPTSTSMPKPCARCHWTDARGPVQRPLPTWWRSPGDASASMLPTVTSVPPAPACCHRSVPVPAEHVQGAVRRQEDLGFAVAIEVTHGHSGHSRSRNDQRGELVARALIEEYDVAVGLRGHDLLASVPPDVGDREPDQAGEAPAHEGLLVTSGPVPQDVPVIVGTEGEDRAAHVDLAVGQDDVREADAAAETGVAPACGDAGGSEFTRPVSGFARKLGLGSARL